MDALALLGAASCAGCGRRAGPLCRGCWAALLPPEPGPCLPHVARVLAPWAYDGAARALVLELKLSGRRGAATPLVEAMVTEARRVGLTGDVVTWVPGRRSESRRRGFDHAELLARGVANRLGLPAAGLLEATGARPDQTALSARDRQANLRGAFVARPCARRVVLVDDVVTTGATAASCAAALRRAGAPGVEALAACRARPGGRRAS